MLAALLSDPDRTAQARRACAPAAGRWVSAARHGLADQVLQQAAVAVFELAVAALPALEPPSWLVDELAVVLEQGMAVRWRDLVGGCDDAALRRLGVAGLQESALRATRWRLLAGVRPATVAFPGAG